MRTRPCDLVPQTFLQTKKVEEEIIGKERTTYIRTSILIPFRRRNPTLDAFTAKDVLTG